MDDLVLLFFFTKTIPHGMFGSRLGCLGFGCQGNEASVRCYFLLSSYLSNKYIGLPRIGGQYGFTLTAIGPRRRSSHSLSQRHFKLSKIHRRLFQWAAIISSLQASEFSIADDEPWSTPGWEKSMGVVNTLGQTFWSDSTGHSFCGGSGSEALGCHLIEPWIFGSYHPEYDCMRCRCSMYGWSTDGMVACLRHMWAYMQTSAWRTNAQAAKCWDDRLRGEQRGRGGHEKKKRVAFCTKAKTKVRQLREVLREVLRTGDFDQKWWWGLGENMTDSCMCILQPLFPLCSFQLYALFTYQACLGLNTKWINIPYLPYYTPIPDGFVSLVQ